MLKTKLLHPQILAQLARMGHGSRILIADGNYPFETASSPSAVKVYLNLMPGVVHVMQVVQAIIETVPLESATIMNADSQVMYNEFSALLPKDVVISRLNKTEFYDQVRSSDTGLVIATAETRRFANILLTIGIVNSCQH
jgi:L-fucose mutarotase